mmetsp:Transcript_6561/g.8330  ORF Transcript_6561/g.8330 Transcript_6561/m.8330 type:complete len:128 (-) Transcript_6561:714-1097(-)
MLLSNIISQWFAGLASGNSSRSAFSLAFALVLFVYVAILCTMWLFILENTAAINFIIGSVSPDEPERLQVLNTTKRMFQYFVIGMLSYFLAIFFGISLFGKRSHNELGTFMNTIIYNNLLQQAAHKT